MPPLGCPQPRRTGCTYVARQVAVKAKYALSVTAAERDAVADVLAACPTAVLPKARASRWEAHPSTWPPPRPQPGPPPPARSRRRRPRSSHSGHERAPGRVLLHGGSTWAHRKRHPHAVFLQCPATAGSGGGLPDSPRIGPSAASWRSGAGSVEPTLHAEMVLRLAPTTAGGPADTRHLNRGRTGRGERRQYA